MGIAFSHVTNNNYDSRTKLRTSEANLVFSYFFLDGVRLSPLGKLATISYILPAPYD
jgi:hypothetical protein